MDFGAVHSFALLSVRPNAAQCLGACSRRCGDRRLPSAELIPWAIHTWEPGGGMLWPAAGKKGCLEGPESQASGRHIPLLSCREPEGNSGDEAHSSQQCPGKEACIPYQQLHRLRQQTSCPRPARRGSKVQSSALSPF